VLLRPLAQTRMTISVWRRQTASAESATGSGPGPHRTREDKRTFRPRVLHASLAELEVAAFLGELGGAELLRNVRHRGRHAGRDGILLLGAKSGQE
jgi:hypothetical protein